MKIGFRKPSVKKSFSARTTGRVTRSIKSATNPLYGKKGMGYIKDPSRAMRNAIYSRTTVGASDMLSTGNGNRSSTGSSYSTSQSIESAPEPKGKSGCAKWLLFLVFGYLFFIVIVFFSNNGAERLAKYFATPMPTQKAVASSYEKLEYLHDPFETLFLEMRQSTTYEEALKAVQASRLDYKEYKSNSSYRIYAGLTMAALQETHTDVGDKVIIHYSILSPGKKMSLEFVVLCRYAHDDVYEAIQLFNIPGYNSSYNSLRKAGAYTRHWPPSDTENEYTLVSTNKEALNYTIYKSDPERLTREELGKLPTQNLSDLDSAIVKTFVQKCIKAKLNVSEVPETLEGSWHRFWISKHAEIRVTYSDTSEVSYYLHLSGNQYDDAAKEAFYVAFITSLNGEYKSKKAKSLFRDLYEKAQKSLATSNRHGLAAFTYENKDVQYLYLYSDDTLDTIYTPASSVD